MAKVIGEATVDDFQYLMGNAHHDDEVGIPYVKTKKVVESSPVGLVVLAEIAPVLANGLISIKHSRIPNQIGDIVRMTGRTQDSIQAANDWESNDHSILKYYSRGFNRHSPIHDSHPATST